MPEERNRLAPPTRLPGGWLGCLGLDTHFQRLFSSSRTHQPPPSPPSNRRFLSDRADPPMIFHYGSRARIYFSRWATLELLDGKRNTTFPIPRPIPMRRAFRCYRGWPTTDNQGFTISRNIFDSGETRPPITRFDDSIIIDSGEGRKVNETSRIVGNRGIYVGRI